MAFTINRRNISPLINKDPDYFDILHELSEMSVIFYDSVTERAWLIDAERAVLQILLHSHQARPGHFKPGISLAFARHDDPKSVHAVMVKNGTTVVRDGLDAETGEQRNIPFSKPVKDLWEKLKNLGNIAQDQYQKSLHSADFHIGKRVLYGFEYLGLVHSTAELEKHPMKKRLVPGCGQWPDLADSLGATILLGDNFQEILLPRPESILCRGIDRLPSGMSYLAADAQILHRLMDRHGKRDNLFRLTPSDLTWMVESPFPTCTTRHVDYCSCNVVQELKRTRIVRDSGTANTLGSWQNGAIIFGNRSYRLKKRKHGAEFQPRLPPPPERALLGEMSTREITAEPIPLEDPAQDFFDDVHQPEPTDGDVEALSPRDRTRQHWSNIGFNPQDESGRLGFGD